MAAARLAGVDSAFRLDRRCSGADRFSVWLVKLLVMFATADPRVRMEVIGALATSNYGLLAIIGAILLSLGLAINRRSVKGSAFGASFEAAGGEDDDDVRG